MLAAGVGHATEAREPIGDDGRARRDDALGEALHAPALEAGDAAELEARGPLLSGLNRHDDRLFAGTAAARLAAGALATEIGIVHLDTAIEGLLALSRRMTSASFVLIFQAVVCVTPRRRPSSIEEMPCLVCVMRYMARNHTVSGTFVESKIVPAVSEVCRRQALHW